VSSPAPAYATIDVGGLRQSLAGLARDVREAVGEIAVHVDRDKLIATMNLLRDTHEYQQLMEIAGVDYPDRAERFEVVYCLLSVTRNHRIRVHVAADEVQPVPSVTGIWPVAGWLEREVYDMYGVLFSGNADLRRILTDYGFRGHPQRKDFPLTGYVELRYSEEAKRVVYEPVSLAQDFRSFDFMSPWEGAEYVLPGDEKGAQPEAKGAPSPVTADQVAKADKAIEASKVNVVEKKTTEKTSDTGAGEPANAQAAKRTRSPRKPQPQNDTTSADSDPAKKPSTRKPRAKKSDS
jgi:NADH-quinone oxidoreductase subunit C